MSGFMTAACLMPALSLHCFHNVVELLPGCLSSPVGTIAQQQPSRLLTCFRHEAVMLHLSVAPFIMLQLSVVADDAALSPMQQLTGQATVPMLLGLALIACSRQWQGMALLSFQHKMQVQFHPVNCLCALQFNSDFFSNFNTAFNNIASGSGNVDSIGSGSQGAFASGSGNQNALASGTNNAVASAISGSGKLSNKSFLFQSLSVTTA